MKIAVGLLAAVAVLVGAGYLAVPDQAALPLATSITVPWEGAPVVPRPRQCRGYVALTFDDGPSPVTGDLLELLAYRDVPATFFNVGKNERAYPDAVRAAARQGHQFGNHSWDHSDLGELSPADVASQLDRTSEIHMRLVGKPYEFFRPPYGSTSPAITKAARDRGMAEALWTIDSKDFETPTVSAVVAQSSQMESGGNVLLHDGHSLTVEAVTYVINSYHRRGLCFGRLASTTDALSPAESPGLSFNVKAVAP